MIAAHELTQKPPLVPPSLTTAEAAERLALREALRKRSSVDHIAQAWYGGIGALILTGLFLRNYETGAARWVLIALGAAAGFAWGFAAVNARHALRLVKAEGIKLSRLAELDARAPKPPELF